MAVAPALATRAEMIDAVDVPLSHESGVCVRLDPGALPKINPYDVLPLLRYECPARRTWLAVAQAYAACGARKEALVILEEATSDEINQMFPHGDGNEEGLHVKLLLTLAGLHLLDAAAGRPFVSMEASAVVREALSKADAAIAKAEGLTQNATAGSASRQVMEARGWTQILSGAPDAAKKYFEACQHVRGASSAASPSACELGLAVVQLNEYHRGTSSSKTSASDCSKLLVSLLRRACCPPGAWACLGYAMCGLGRFQLARKLFERGLDALNSPYARSFERVEMLSALATLEANEGNCERALDLLILACQQNQSGGDPRVLCHLTEVFFLAGDLNLATRFAHLTVQSVKALVRPPRALKIDAHFQLARVHHKSGKLSEAEVEYFTAIEEGANSSAQVHPGARLNLGLLLLSRSATGSNLIDMAINHLERVKNDNETVEGLPRQALGVALCESMRDDPRALHAKMSHVMELLDRSHGPPAEKHDLPALVWHARLHEAHDPEVALSSYAAIIKLLSNETETKLRHNLVSALNNQASLLVRIGRIAEAREVQQRAMNIAEELVRSGSFSISDFVTLLYNEAYLLELTGDALKSSEYYKQIIETFGTHVDAHLRLGIIATDAGDFAQAQRHLELAMKGKCGAGSDILVELFNRNRDFHRVQTLVEENCNVDEYAALQQSSFYLECLRNVEKDRRKRWLERIWNVLIRVLKADPQNAVAVNGVGCLFAEEGDFRAAHEAFSSVVAHPFIGDLAKVNFANAKIELGRKTIETRTSFIDKTETAIFDQSAKLFEDREARFPSCRFKGEHVLGYACALFEAHRLEECLRVMQRAVHLMPQFSPVLFDLALTLQELSDRTKEDERSLAVLQKVVGLVERATRIFSVLTNSSAHEGPGPARERVGRDVAEQHFQYCRGREKRWKLRLINVEADTRSREEDLRRRREKMAETQRAEQESLRRKQEEEDEQRRKWEEQARMMEEKLEQNKKRWTPASNEVDAGEDDGEVENHRKKERKVKRKYNRRAPQKVALEAVHSSEEDAEGPEVELEPDQDSGSDGDLAGTQEETRRKRLRRVDESDSDAEKDVFSSSDEETPLLLKPE